MCSALNFFYVNGVTVNCLFGQLKFVISTGFRWKWLKYVVCLSHYITKVIFHNHMKEEQEDDVSAACSSNE